MKVNYINVGRDSASWTKDFGTGATEEQVAREAKRGGRLMSADVEALMDDSGSGGEIVVGGFRTVGTFTISH